MTGYDPARSRRPAAESAVDAVFASSKSNGAEGRSAGPAGPTVMPAPAPSDDVLLLMGAVGGALIVIGLYIAIRRWRHD